MDVRELEQVRRHAAARVALRRSPHVARTRSLRFPGGDVIEASATGREGAEFAPPQTLGEWIDDALTIRGCGQWAGAHTPVLVEALETARMSPARAAGVLAAGARALAPWARWRLYQSLGQLAGQPTPLAGARDLMRELTSAYEGIRGAVLRRPDEPEQELGDPPGPQRIRYRSPLGQPPASCRGWREEAAMPKIDSTGYSGGPAAVVVPVPRDDALAGLLRGSGGHFERLLNALGNGAAAGNSVTIFGSDVPGVSGDLTALLHRARAEGHPAAEGVAGILRRLGAPVPPAPAPEPERAPEPEPAPPKPAPPRPPAPPLAAP